MSDFCWVFLVGLERKKHGNLYDLFLFLSLQELLLWDFLVCFFGLNIKKTRKKHPFPKKGKQSISQCKCSLGKLVT